MLVGVGAGLGDRLDRLTAAEIYDDGGEQIGGRTILPKGDDREAEGVLAEARLGARGQSEEFQVLGPDLEAVRGIGRQDGKGHEAERRIFQVLEEDQGLGIGEGQRHEAAGLLEARQAGRKLERGRFLINDAAEVSGVDFSHSGPGREIGGEGGEL